jgi:hypothetical protein
LIVGCQSHPSDFVIVILWGRFGTPLPDSVRKPSGERYLSGTEWEYEDAISAKRQPEILIYRRIERVLLDADDPEYQPKVEQRKRVNQFFERFPGLRSQAFPRASLLEAVARLPRKQVLNAVSASINISVAFSGAQAVEDIRRAISDTASWYP